MSFDKIVASSIKAGETDKAKIEITSPHFLNARGKPRKFTVASGGTAPFALSNAKKLAKQLADEDVKIKNLSFVAERGVDEGGNLISAPFQVVMSVSKIVDVAREAFPTKNEEAEKQADSIRSTATASASAAK